LALGIIGYKTTGFADTGAPPKADSTIGQQVITQHFPGASNNPQFVIFKFAQPVWNNLADVAKAQTELADGGRFKAVSGPLNANGLMLSPQSLQQMHALAPSSPVMKIISQFISADGRTVQFYVISNAGSPGSSASISATPANRVLINTVGRNVGAEQSAIYGSDSIGYDIDHTATDDLKKIIPVVLIIIGLLLAIMLRSLVAPLYLILTVGLSYLGALGFAMLAFVHFGGQDGLNFILPFMMFIFSMALGEDYNILVMSRIREEAHGSVSLNDAVKKAMGITGTTVTSAGLVLAGTFGVLGLVGGNQQIEQIGYAIAFGILLDTFFVRTLLVPSIVVLLGRWNWWPSKMSRPS